MPLPILLRAAPLVLLCSLAAPASAAEDSAAQINARLKAGGEVAWLIDDSTNKDGDLAVLFTARLKASKPAEFPYLVHGELRPAETDALNAFDEASGQVEESVVMENLVVALKEKRVLGRLNLGKPDDEVVYFPGKNHGSLEVVWGPEEEGWHFGLLNFGRKWDSSAVILLESDGEHIRQLDIKPVLDAKVTALLKAKLKGKKGIDSARYAISYNELKVVDPDVGYSVGNPVTVTLGASAEIPKSTGDEPYVEATLTVLLETSRDKISARVLKAEPKKQ